MFVPSIPGKAGPEASSPSERLHFYAESISSHMALALP